MLISARHERRLKWVKRLVFAFMCSVASLGVFFAVVNIHTLFKENERLQEAAENNPPRCCEFERKFRREWRDCEADVDVYSRQSIEFVCWEEYTWWMEQMDGVYEEKWAEQEKLKKCRERLTVLEVADKLRVLNNQ